MAVSVSDGDRRVNATVLFAVDLDRTLIYSRRWLSGADSDMARCVEVRDGREISFMTRTAVASLEQLASRHIVVPATTRTVAQYLRVALPGGPYRYAVTSNGGVILDDGQPDLVWAAQVAATLRAESIALEALLRALHRRIGEAWVQQVIVADDLFCCLVVDESALPADFVALWQIWCEPRGWTVVRQDRRIYSLPRSLCKSHAVDEVRRRLTDSGELADDAPLLAAGDSALDAALLSAATAAIRPSHGELRGMGSHLNRVSDTTAAHGAHAAEQVLQWCWLQAASFSGDRPRPQCAVRAEHEDGAPVINGSEVGSTLTATVVQDPGGTCALSADTSAVRSHGSAWHV